ncbi:TonB-dependent receptor [Temperatibacter marinus]|uniref:TonB-dependent receptor n=1 Tax=Temperatibacter marinus TaxID=1456591 RepID=A0AA52EH70_9PROT|nr:TonB-dependent receptor [Temperatibacter marinus]WND03598.1 TonB-dependent receptor [Temperatibacter marinus]
MQRMYGLVATVSTISLLVGHSSAYAEDDDRGHALEEIIVTAQHRSANVQDVPVTVSVLSEDLILKRDIFDAHGIAMNTPGLAYGEFSPGQASFSMRGVGSSDDGAGLDNSVALFLDGVYIGRGAGINFDMFDLQRIEVLKGPQGALFGRNTIGGAINVVSKKPTDELVIKSALTYGNENIFRAQGLISGPLSDNLFGKVVVNHRSHDGFVRNTLLNKDVNDEDQTSFRGQLRLALDRSDWLLSGDYMEDHREDTGRFPFRNGNFDYVGTAEALGANKPQTTAAPVEGYTDRKGGGLSLQGDVQFGNGILTTITSFRSIDTDWAMPSVGAPLGGNYDLDADVYGSDVIDHIEEKVETFSEEIRWTSNLGHSLEFIAGLYFFTENTDRPEQWSIQRNTVDTGQVIVGNEYSLTANKTTSYAAYGQAQWTFAEDWTLSFGGRYSHDRKEYTTTAVNCGLDEAVRAAAGFPNFELCGSVGGSLGIIAEVFNVEVDGSWSDFSPMASIQYQATDDLMVFATWATGFKSGGFAGSAGVEAVAQNIVEPETVTNYEIGFKGDFFANQLRMNVTGFYMDYKDLQVVRFGPVPESSFGTFTTTNLGSAEIKGFEVEMVWQLTEYFHVNANYAFLDTVGNDLIINGTDVSGKDLRQAPRNSYNLDLNYSLPMENKGTLDFNIHFTHIDEERMDYQSDLPVISERNLTDARVSWTSNDERYQIALWAKNIFDKAYVAHSYIIGPGAIGIWGPPRTFGATLSASF